MKQKNSSSNSAAAWITTFLTKHPFVGVPVLVGCALVLGVASMVSPYPKVMGGIGGIAAVITLSIAAVLASKEGQAAAERTKDAWTLWSHVIGIIGAAMVAGAALA